MSKKNLPRVPSKVSTQRHQGLVAPIGAGATRYLRLKPDEERIFLLAGAIDGLMPKHRLSGQAIGAAAAAVELARNGYGKLLIEEFARRTTLRPGTKAYNRAEFCNVIYALSQWAYAFNAGKRAPAFLAPYFFYSAAGAGPHPDSEFWQTLSSGMSSEKRAEAERRFRSWRSHLRNRIAVVKKALKQHPSLSERRRKSILGADPLIADLVTANIPARLRLNLGRLR